MTRLSITFVLLGAAVAALISFQRAVPLGQTAPTLAIPERGLALPKAHAWERARWHMLKRLPAGATQVPRGAMELARQQSARLPRSSAPQRYQKHAGALAKAAASWQSMGPNRRGGRTRRIVFNSQGTMFAAGVSGGVWRFEQTRWEPLGDRLANVNVGALAIAPDNDQVMYAGTGELYRRTNRAYASMTGSGVFKSTNGGQDWLQLSASNNENFDYVSDLVVSSVNPQRIYAATNTGVWQSSNGGTSFSQSLDIRENAGSRFEGCTDLDLLNDGGRDRLLVSCASRSTDDRYYLPGLLPGACAGPCDGRVYLNADAASGQAWDVVLSEPGMGRTSLAYSASDPAVVYALSASTVPGPDKTGDGIGDYDNGLHGVFRSDDGGSTWTAQLRNTDSDPVSTWMLSFAWQARTDNNTPYGAGWYNQAIAVDPDNPDVVWVGGMQLYRSDNAGQNFGLTSNYYSSNNVPGSQGPEMHPDIHALVFDRSGDLWVGNDGGVWRARDIDAPTDRIRDGYRSLLSGGMRFDAVVTDYTTTQFYHGSVSPNGELVLGGMQDNGTDVYNYPGYPNQWVRFLGGDGAHTAFNSQDLSMWISAQNGYLVRVDRLLQFEQYQERILAQAKDADELMFITPFELDPQDQGRIFVGGKRLIRGRYDEDVWQVASAPFGTEFADKTNTLAVANDQPWVLAGTGNAIYRITSANTSSASTVPGSTQPRAGWVSSLIFDPGDTNVAYATYSSFGGDHVFKSTDGGQSFVAIDGSGAGRLPDVPVHSLAIHPELPDSLYVGTDLGVFFTQDGGDNWQLEDTGFGGAIVERVVINQPDFAGTVYLFAFTYGRGVWRAPLAEVDGASPFEISAEVSGLWYDESEPGHGVQVQVIDGAEGQRLLATWYVYENGKPLWLIGTGEVGEDRATLDMTVTTGADFGSRFDPADVVREPWGTLELVFASTSELSMGWQSTYGEGRSGTLSLQRLTQPADIRPAGSPVTLCSTAVYNNPNEDGHGIVLETIEQDGSPAIAWSWFHYRGGEQLWLVGSGAFADGQVESEAFAGVTGDFPPVFAENSAQVSRWGTVTFRFSGERQFTVDYLPDDGSEPAGSLTFDALTTLADSNCTN
ncbi:MAG: hypothetical protein AB8B96_00320 [Lysobacterales bacterium]